MSSEQSIAVMSFLAERKDSESLPPLDFHTRKKLSVVPASLKAV